MKLKFLDEKYFLINKKVSNPVKITGTKNKSFLITEDNGFVLKNTCDSKTYLAVDPVKNVLTAFGSILTVEEVEIDFILLNNIFKKTNFFEFSIPEQVFDETKNVFNENIKDYVTKTIQHVTYINTTRLTICLGYGLKQIKKIIEKLKLTKIKEGLYIRYAYKDMTKMLRLYQSINLTKGDLNELKIIYPEYTLNFIIESFKGDSIEICAFYWLEIYFEKTDEEKNYFENVKNIIFDEYDIESVVKYIEKLYLEDKNSVQILKDLYIKNNMPNCI